MGKLKKIIVTVLIAAFITAGIPGSIFLQEPAVASAAVPSVQAKAYVVMDANSGNILYKKDMDKKIYPASTVKLMTAIVAVNNASLGKNITFTQNMRNRVPADASKLGLKVGTSYTVKQYLHMMLIASDADSAVALASATAGSYNKFIQFMNNTAKSYGMDKTSFDNPIGLDTGNGFNKTYTSAYDFTLLARRAMSYQVIRNIVAKNTYKVPARAGKPSFSIKNTNGFYSSYKLSGKKYSIIGSKTGTTRAAGRVLVATARDSGGHELVCAYFGGETPAALYGGIEELLDYAFKQYTSGKKNLVAGFWDTRYHKGGDTINKYATSGLLPMTANGRFNPDRVKSSTYTINLINKISGLKMKTSSSSSLTVTNLALAYYNLGKTSTDTDVTTGSAVTGSAVTESAPADGTVTGSTTSTGSSVTSSTITSKEHEVLDKLFNIGSFNVAKKKKIATLYLSGAMDNVDITDVKHKLTKEEAVLIADQLSE